VPIERAAFIDMLKRNFPAEASGIDRLFATTKAIQEAARQWTRNGPGMNNVFASASAAAAAADSRARV